MGTEEPVLVLDTPGVNDTQNRDTKNISQIVVHLKEIGYVNTFLLVLNSQVPRISEGIQDYLRLYVEVFGENFFEHVMLVFTRFAQSEQGTITR